MFAKRVLQLVPQKWRRKVREQRISASVTHLHGPKSTHLAHNEAVVTCVVRNGEFYIERFIQHYLQMGFRHIFFLDNGSSDRTISIAKSHNNVTVCTSSLPIDGNQALLKKYLAERSAKGGWCLDADIDEFFDYPFSEVVGLREFLDYLNGNHYTAVITQLLDMFSDTPLSDLAQEPNENLENIYQYYDLSRVTKTKYAASAITARHGSRNQLSNPDAHLCWGGIRHALYGNNCLLTKHSLFVPGSGIELFPHVHFVDKARLADVSCVMLHYKLTKDALSAALQNQARFTANSTSYGDFIEFLVKRPSHHIKADSAVRLRTISDLIDSDFVFVSKKYSQYARMLPGSLSGSNVIDAVR